MSAPVLVCFAVRREAKPFFYQKLAASRRDVRVIVTGMGARNAERAVRDALAKHNAARVFTSGFVGALDPALRIGEVVFEADGDELVAKLRSAGARAASFCCVERVAVTASEKAALRQETSADAVEMESAMIHRVCYQADVPCATVRAVSDLASEDLPLDFNALMTPDMRLSPVRLALAIFRSPCCIPALMRLGRNSAFAAEQLAEVLMKVV